MSLWQSQDAELKGLCENEQQFEIETVYRQHGNWLISFLRRRFGRDEAEDLAQETYLRAARVDAPVRHPRALLAQIATNLARDRIRRAAARPRLVPDEGHAERQAEAAGQLEALLLKQAILALPANLRTVFLLSRLEGLTYDEIGKMCGLPVKTVEWRMTKALAMLAARVRD